MASRVHQGMCLDTGQTYCRSEPMRLSSLPVRIEVAQCAKGLVISHKQHLCSAVSGCSDLILCFATGMPPNYKGTWSHVWKCKGCQVLITYVGN